MAALAGALMVVAAGLLFVLLYHFNRLTPRPWPLRSYVVSEVGICAVLGLACVGAALVIFRSDPTAFLALGAEAAVLLGGVAGVAILARALAARRRRTPAPTVLPGGRLPA